jgi:hypothetical protein
MIQNYYLKLATGVLLIPIIATSPIRCGATESSLRPGLSVENGKFIKNGKPYRAVGANYFDLFLRILANPQDRSSVEGLQQLSTEGIPFVRFALSFNSQQWKIYRESPDKYFQALDLVFCEAEKSGVGLIPSFFWTADLPHLVNEHRDSWGDPNSQTTKLMREIVAAVIARYKNSPALWAYEFGNEPNLVADLPNAASLRKKGDTEQDDMKSSQTVIMLSEFAKAVRASDPYRPIISGNSHARAAAWHNTHENSWKPDSRQQCIEITKRDNPAGLDTLGIHFYADGNDFKELGAWVNSRLEYLKMIRSIADEERRPVFVGEFGLANKPEPEATRAAYKDLLEAIEKSGVDLAAFWVYDLKNQKDWNITLTNDRAYMLKEAAAVNRSLSTAGALRPY